MTIQQIILGQTKLKGRKEGIKIGERKAKLAIVSRMLKHRNFTDDEIAALAEVTQSVISRVRKRIEKVN